MTLTLSPPRYVTTCPKCRTPRAIDVAGNPTDFFNAVNGWCGPAALVRCVTCNRALTQWTAITGRYSESHACDVRCTSARGHKCECQCGGHNHGADNL